MTYYEVSQKLAQINRAIECVTTLHLMENTHGLDRELLREEALELHRAAHDTLREWEFECMSRGKSMALQTVDR